MSYPQHSFAKSIVSALGFALAILLSFTPARASASPVELVKAVPGFCGGASGTGGTVCVPHKFVIKVSNIAFEKDVSIHFETTQAAASVWSTRQGFYLESLSESEELWQVEIDAFTAVEHFVVRYDVAGQTYWDNNSGSDYYLHGNTNLGPSFNAAFQASENVCRACAPGFDLGGNIIPLGGAVYVRNIAPTKIVTIVYSRDNWATVETVDATFSGGPNDVGIERFSFFIDWQDSETIEFAIAYDVAGSTYWDNNFGRNYLFERPTR